MSAKKAGKTITVTLIKSPISTLPRHRDCVKGLGLRRLRHTVVVEDTPAIRGMINKVSYLLNVQES
ncbi:MAG: rpmD [Gammaproteobacteria bacterium]|jgi:large subunit ribosomal protein L30|nr:rpmD [Gammaproteobacteria bacterium]